MLRFRATNTWFRLPLLHLLSSPTHSKPKTFASFSSPSSEFLPWLRAKSGHEISSVLTIGNTDYGRSLIASDFIKAGDCILQVPFSSQLKPDNLPPEIYLLLSDDVGHVARLALVLLIEIKKGQDSKWEPYISCLPQPGELHSTIFWSKEELDMIGRSSVHKETVDRKVQLEKEYFMLRPAIDQFPEFFEDTTFEHFMHAFEVVASRAWGSSEDVSLVPFADFLNHDGVSEAILLNDEVKQTSEVIADQDYAPGKQVLIRYGKFPNSTLLLDFGFTLSYNSFDLVQIQMSVPQDDPLCLMKVELLHKHSIPCVKNSRSLGSLQHSFIIKKEARNEEDGAKEGSATRGLVKNPWEQLAFSPARHKEIRSDRKTGKSILQSLRAFVRVLCADSVQELRDMELVAAQTDGRLARHPLKNIYKEIQSHQLLLSLITDLIRDYDALLKSLKLIDANCTSGKSAIRKKMAQDLLSGELRILKSASAWLSNYCSTLSKGTTVIHQKVIPQNSEGIKLSSLNCCA